MAQAIECSRFGRKGSVPQGVAPPVRTRLLAMLAAAVLLAVAAPPAHADPAPVDYLGALTARTIEYEQGFDPNGNATTQQERTQAYLADVADLGHLLGYLLCFHFQLGSWQIDLLPHISSPPLEVKWDIPGYGVQGDIFGSGTYKLEASPNGLGTCSIWLPFPAHIGDPLKTRPGV